tara:strand:- start:588 stop:1067 length:480 start_codon:yes stop_codon:yes gene_type:complete
MRTIANIKRDFNSNISNDRWIEDLKEELNYLDVNVWTKYKQNSIIEEILKNQNTLPDQFSKNVTVKAIGYVQGEYTLFQIYYNGDDYKLKFLKELLERTYTHKNDYLIETIEMLSSGHSKTIDTAIISINDVEFPELNHIKKSINEHQEYKYDKYIFED